jgi:predicted SAM-dependent methyltransferase
LILNWGCGEGGGIEKAINLDMQAQTKPDFVETMTERWDWEDKSIDEVWMHHVIEHIPKSSHAAVFLEANRVLKNSGKLFLAYPDFEKCAKNFLENKDNKREFWEATLFGLQRYTGDFHVCAITSRYLRSKLSDVGFRNFVFLDDQNADFYGTCLCEKVLNSISYEEAQRLQWQS